MTFADAAEAVLADTRRAMTATELSPPPRIRSKATWPFGYPTSGSRRSSESRSSSSSSYAGSSKKPATIPKRRTTPTPETTQRGCSSAGRMSTIFEMQSKCCLS